MPLGGGKTPLELLSLFYPWEKLSQSFDPCGEGTRRLEDVVRAARSKAEEILRRAGIAVRQKPACG
jgi:hypothetical protein